MTIAVNEKFLCQEFLEEFRFYGFKQSLRISPLKQLKPHEIFTKPSRKLHSQITRDFQEITENNLPKQNVFRPQIRHVWPLRCLLKLSRNVYSNKRRRLWNIRWVSVCFVLFDTGSLSCETLIVVFYLSSLPPEHVTEFLRNIPSSMFINSRKYLNLRGGEDGTLSSS